MTEYRFSKSQRLLKRKNFLILSEEGTICHSSLFIGVFKENTETVCSERLGITVSKKVGNSVSRNRIKRLVREYWRIYFPLKEKNIDINIIAKRNCGIKSNKEIFKSLSALFKKINEKLK